jgi:hypothetical protein
VHDEVGKKVLALIQLLLPTNKSVEDFGKDEMDEYFGVGNLSWTEWNELSNEEKANKKKEWGLAE